MHGATQIQLPNGFWRSGSRHLDAVVRPLTGEDEEFALDALPAAPAARATELLSRCVLRLGSLERVSSEDVRALPAGDREALLLQVRKLSFGPRVQSTVTCPACAQALDLDFLIDDVLLPPREEAAETYGAQFVANRATYRVRFRLPTGADQEAAVEAAEADQGAVGAGVKVLLSRCVNEAFRNESPVPPARLPAAVVNELSRRISEADPQAEVELACACPSCGHEFLSLFDAGAFLFDEIALRIPNLYREVHTLAFYYHWSETEILRMTTRKRARYLDLLRESVSPGDTP